MSNKAAVFAPEDSSKAQSEAWFSVCRTLDVVYPGWMTLKKSTSESAVEAIMRLASGAIRITVGAGK